jgi:hypothetical protein
MDHRKLAAGIRNDPHSKILRPNIPVDTVLTEVVVSRSPSYQMPEQHPILGQHSIFSTSFESLNRVTYQEFWVIFLRLLTVHHSTVIIKLAYYGTDGLAK